MERSRKTVLITGASAGIGRATANRLIDDGWLVYATAPDPERLAALEERGARGLHLDVTDEATAREATETILAAEGRIDALVNNAGYGSYGAIEDVSIDEVKRQFDVNLFGLGRMIQLVAPAMRAQRSGTIVNVSSMGGRFYSPMGGWYHASKFAVEGLSDCLRFELEPFGIRVVVIEPGTIRSEFRGIIQEKLRKTSGEGPYRDMAAAMARRIDRAYDGFGTQPPEAVAGAISRALRARRPRTRYAVGVQAKAAVTVNRLLSDRMWDRIMRKQL